MWQLQLNRAQPVYVADDDGVRDLSNRPHFGKVLVQVGKCYIMNRSQSEKSILTRKQVVSSVHRIHQHSISA